MSKKGYYINIYTNKTKSDFLQIRYGRFNASIPKSYIEENNLAIKSDNMFINKELYEKWFKEEIENDREYWRKRQEVFNSFYPHIPLFYECREMILNEPRFYGIRPPYYIMGLAYCGASSATLGELLLIWENEETMTFTCECGGKKFCFLFSGSPLSGTQGDSQTICSNCGKWDTKGGASSSLGSKIKARIKYKAIEPRAEKVASYEELIKECIKFNA
ncbi:MAG: hypothetical protein LBI15_03045 [Dysgonamonadaceae bacterium]|jgi:hypothetical protein|nr:hypothetical protein [Dysgonamonadaceae bacterium]